MPMNQPDLNPPALDHEPLSCNRCSIAVIDFQTYTIIFQVSSSVRDLIGDTQLKKEKKEENKNNSFPVEGFKNHLET